MTDASSAELSGRQRKDRQTGPPSPEALANSRFITIFQRIIEERAELVDSEADGGEVKMALLPRIPGWEPDKTKFADIKNAINRIFVAENSGFSTDEFNSREVTIADFDPEDSSKYYWKQFKITGDRVGVTIDHLYVKPREDEPRQISSQEIDQAPPEMLNTASDEIEAILAQPTAA